MLDLIETRIAIIGLGLMGGSLAMGLQGKCSGIYGADTDPKALDLAHQSGIFDGLSEHPAEILANTGLVVLAAPVGAILKLLEDLPDLHSGSPVVLDLGSTKRQISAAMALLPPRFDPLGGHPMTGKEKSGLDNASAGLFRGAPFAFTPLPRTTIQARHLAGQICEAVGARPLWLEPDRHDRWTAATSHLPYLVASALALATPVEAAPLVGPGFRSTTRVAASSPEVMVDIVRSNADHILAALGRFRDEIDRMEQALKNGEWQALAGQLSQAAASQKDLTYEHGEGGRQ
ncbi:MAG: prephenate dehydrogenase [Chloroflexota bacterium]|nr:MAG: prephenate dehydrogenase [Chloroflexota bacterium]